MQLFILILHIVLCFALILIILLQPGKDGASVFGGGGGGNQMYGSRGQANFLGRMTTVVAALFMFTSITLAYRSSLRNQSGSDIEEDIRRLQETQRSSTSTTEAPSVAPASLEVEEPTLPTPEATEEPGSDQP